MFNHFQYEILIYNEYFSRSHNLRDNICPPLFSLMVDFNIEAYGEKYQDRVICSHLHNVKGRLNISKEFSIINNIRNVISISVHIHFFNRQFPIKNMLNFKKKAHGMTVHMVWQTSHWTIIWSSAYLGKVNIETV